MIITCPECETRYRYDERRFDGALAKKVKCTSCGHTFEAENPAVQDRQAQEATDLGGSDRYPPSDPTPLPIPAGPDVPTSPPGSIPEPPTATPAAAADVDAGSGPDDPLPPLPTDQRYSLAVIAGGQAGSVFQIHKSSVLIGRGSTMDIQLRDSEVSRRHALIEIRPDVVTLTDLGATNGTWFGGSQVETVELEHQDEFTLGSTTLMLIVTETQGAR